MKENRLKNKLMVDKSSRWPKLQCHNTRHDPVRARRFGAILIKTTQFQIKEN